MPEQKTKTGYGELRRASVIAAVVAGLFFLAGLGTFVGAIVRLGGERSELRTAISTARFEAERQTKAARVQGALREEKDAIASLRSLFLSSSNIIPFVESIESLGRALPVGLSLSSVTLAPSKDALLARLSAHGNFVELYRMLAIIEALPYKTVIGDTQLIYGGADSRGLLVASHGNPKEQSSHDGKDTRPQWSLSVAITVKSILPEKF